MDDGVMTAGDIIDLLIEHGGMKGYGEAEMIKVPASVWPVDEVSHDLKIQGIPVDVWSREEYRVIFELGHTFRSVAIPTVSGGDLK